MDAGSVSELRAAYDDAVRQMAIGNGKPSEVEAAWKALVNAIVAANQPESDQIRAIKHAVKSGGHWPGSDF